MTQIQEIALDDIKSFPGNRRIGGFDQEKLEQLAESIRDIGVQQPAIVRRAFDAPPSYELVAGERRWRASRLAGKDKLPCIVRELSDLEALKIQLIENLQRDDVHPLDEAHGFTQLLESKEYDVAVLADEIGRSRSYIYQRLKLTELIEPAQEALLSGEISTGLALQIARLTPELQQDALEWCVNGYGSEISVKDLSNYIANNLMLELDRAAFPKDDADLVPEAGPCSMCMKRTGRQPELFADMAKDRCMDGDCFHAKQDALVERRRSELEGEDYLEVASAYESDLPRSVVKSWEWQECPQKTEGARRVLIVGGPDRGRVTWGRKLSDVPRPAPAKEDLEIAAEQEAAEFEYHVNEAVWNRVCESVFTRIGEDPESLLYSEPILRILVESVVFRMWNERAIALINEYGWEREKITTRWGEQIEHPAATFRRNIESLDHSELVRHLVVCILNSQTGQPYADREDAALWRLSEMLGLAPHEIARQVRAEMTEEVSA